jgi:Flp pilus assembly pilin Flp
MGTPAMDAFKNFTKNEVGTASIEYALIAVIISICFIGAARPIGPSLASMIVSVADALTQK